VDRGATEGPPAGRALVAPGLEATYVDQAPAAARAGPGAAPTWRYVVVPVAGGDRRPAASNLVEMPLGAVVPPVEDLEATYDASAWRLAWTASGPEVSFVVLELPAEGGGEPAPLTEAAIEATEFRAPLEFGRRRCFVVRPVLVRGAATIEGPASAPACDTPVDTFAPPAPAGLVAVQVGGAVDLRWAASAAADLAGYVVLRGEGAGETLQPLVTAPVAGTSYRDEAVRAGVTYIYEVVAVDRATPPNTSPPSNRQTVVVRQASGGS
jgi:hypothetical protein